MTYDFTTDWFDNSRGTWTNLFAKIEFSKILEIGSFEGASATFCIEQVASARDLELHCVDSWRGGAEHSEIDMEAVEQRFNHNTALAIEKAEHNVSFTVHKGLSSMVLPELLAEHRGSFDLVYIDGSHQAPHVLTDAVLAFELTRLGGFMIFDDYVWQEQIGVNTDPLRNPKIAIDAFVNINSRRLLTLQAQNYQCYVRKIAD